MEHEYLRDLWDEKWDPPLNGNFSLEPWQKLGVTFLHQCRERGYALLGDEMGIGKVIHMNVLD